MQLGIGDRLDAVLARVRLLELALLGAEGSGMSLDGGEYLDAMTQQVRDIAEELNGIRDAHADDS